jgi:hypothetical protein
MKMNKRNITAEIYSFIIQLKPILDIFLRAFNLSCYPQHSPNVLFLLNPMCLWKYIYVYARLWTEFFKYILSRISEGLLYVVAGVLSCLGTLIKYVSLLVYWCLIEKVLILLVLYCG